MKLRKEFLVVAVKKAEMSCVASGGEVDFASNVDTSLFCASDKFAVSVTCVHVKVGEAARGLPLPHPDSKV